MATASAESRSQRARLAHSTRQFGADSPQANEARRDFAAARLADHVREIVGKAPALTEAQVDRIASLLRVNPERPQACHADVGLPDADDRVGGEV